MPKLITHNLPGWLPLDDRLATVRRLCGMADVVALQESPWLDPTDLPDGWALHRGNDPALPVLTTDRHEVTASIDWRAYPATDVGSWGAGPSELRAGWDYGVRLARPSDGAECWVINAHLPPSAELDPPDDPDDRDGWELRRELHTLETSQLVTMTAALPGPVFVLGDFNADPDGPLMDPLGVGGFRVVTGRTYKDGRRLDHIWHRADTGLVEGPTEISTPSDHDALYARFRIPAP